MWITVDIREAVVRKWGITQAKSADFANNKAFTSACPHPYPQL